MEDYVTRSEMQQALQRERQITNTEIQSLSGRVDDFSQTLNSISLGMQEVGKVTQAVNDLRRELRGGEGDGPESIWSILKSTQQTIAAIYTKTDEQQEWIDREMATRRFRQKIYSAAFHAVIGRWRILTLLTIGISSLTMALIGR